MCVKGSGAVGGADLEAPEPGMPSRPAGDAPRAQADPHHPGDPQQHTCEGHEENPLCNFSCSVNQVTNGCHLPLGGGGYFMGVARSSSLERFVVAAVVVGLGTATVRLRLTHDKGKVYSPAESARHHDSKRQKPGMPSAVVGKRGRRPRTNTTNPFPHAPPERGDFSSRKNHPSAGVPSHCHCKPVAALMKRDLN